MCFLTKLLKKIGKWLLIFLLFVFSYLLAAWIFASLPVNQAQPKGEITLFLVSNGVHTDVVMPLKNEIFDDFSQLLNKKSISKRINDNMIFKKLSTITKPKSAIYICFRNVYAMI